MKLSHTGLKNADCPYRFKMLLDGHKEPDNPFALIGRLFHEIPHDVIAHLLTTGQTTDWTFTEEIVQGKIALEENPMVRRDVLMLANRWKESFIIEPEVQTFPELKLAVDWDRKPVDFDLEQGYRGIIDLLEIKGDYCRIRDWKTGWTAMGYGESAHSPQLLGYAVLVAAHHPEIERFDLSVEYIRKNLVEPSMVRRAELKHHWAAILRKRKRIEKALSAKKIKAKRCAQCDYCKLDCPLPEKGNAGIPQTENEAKLLIESIVGHKQQLEKAIALLKPYCETHGEIAHLEKFTGFRQTQTQVYGEQEVYGAMKAANIDNHLLDMCFGLMTDVMIRKLVDAVSNLQTREVMASADVIIGKATFGTRQSEE